MLPTSPALLRRSLLWLAALLLCGATGCVGLTSQILYMIHGNTVPAAYGGLKGKRVAVVCVSGGSSYGAGSAAESISRHVTALLARNVKDIEIVRHDEIMDWIDNHDWNEIDPRQVGRGVKADMVVSVDLAGFRYHENQTLFRGHADVTITAYDLASAGEPVFRRRTPDFAYPATGGRHVTEVSEQEFRQSFVEMLSWHIAKQFFDYEAKLDFAGDGDAGMSL